jgi:hypothetical protein
MSKIFIPSPGSTAWQQFLAEPDKQWRSGYSAKTLACCWEACDGLPVEIGKLFAAEFNELPELLLAIPEHKVPLPGGTRASQIDVFALLRVAGQTVSVAVEGKVAEPFGPTLNEWLANPSDGKQIRLAYLRGLLGLPDDVPGELRYQLLHRAGSAIVEANRFKTDLAAMIVHSFSPERIGFDSYTRFVEILGVDQRDGALSSTKLPDGRKLYVGWANGDQMYRGM